jgi:ribosome biogenesis GTPase
MDQEHKTIIPRKQKGKRSLERIQIKSNKLIPIHAVSGIISSIVGKNFIVQAENLLEFECIVSGTIYSEHGKASILSVGDKVSFLPPDLEKGINFGSIIYVETRKSWLSRKPLIGVREDVVAVNAEILMIIMSADNPVYNTRLIDRLIVSALVGNLKPALCINKIDLMDIAVLNSDLKIYRQLGCPVIFVSAHSEIGIDELKLFLHGKHSIFTGPSGVGKSSILNKILGYPVQKIQDVSTKTSKGKHTTSTGRLFRIDDNCSIIDTPGIREFGIVNIKKEELTLYFKEFADFYEHCRFMPWSHTHEPGCEVKSAVERGKITEERYISYVNIYETLK